jgi:hypothetical protein
MRRQRFTNHGCVPRVDCWVVLTVCRVENCRCHHVSCVRDFNEVSRPCALPKPYVRRPSITDHLRPALLRIRPANVKSIFSFKVFGNQLASYFAETPCVNWQTNALGSTAEALVTEATSKDILAITEICIFTPPAAISRDHGYACLSGPLPAVGKPPQLLTICPSPA